MATPNTSDHELEKRYETEDRDVSQERNDFLLPQIVDFVSKNQWMNLRPEYQRRQVWDGARQSRFIESLLMNLPVPPVFLFEHEYNRYEVMDGQQRLSSILAFYEGRLRLSGLEHWKELKGKLYSELPEMIQRGFDRRRISAVVLRTPLASKRSESLRRIVFERLNTGGQRLNAQELRNCVYASPFASLLIELAGTPIFNDLCGIPRYSDQISPDGRIGARLAANSLYKRMIDCELVLRFFAFRDVRAIKGSVKSILDGCMKTNVALKDNELGALRNAFTSRVELAAKLLGPSAFKLRDLEKGTLELSYPYYDAVMVACDRLFGHRAQLLHAKTELRELLQSKLSRRGNHELIVGKANTAESIRKRLSFVERCFKSVL